MRSASKAIHPHKLLSLLILHLGSPDGYSTATRPLEIGRAGRPISSDPARSSEPAPPPRQKAKHTTDGSDDPNPTAAGRRDGAGRGRDVWAAGVQGAGRHSRRGTGLPRRGDRQPNGPKPHIKNPTPNNHKALLRSHLSFGHTSLRRNNDQAEHTVRHYPAPQRRVPLNKHQHPPPTARSKQNPVQFDVPRETPHH